jgi:hypothetical protein
LPGAVIAEGGAGRVADVHVHALDRATNLHGRVGRQRPRLQRLIALPQRGSVAQRFLGRRIRLAFADAIEEEHLIRGGHDVLDLAAGLGFEQRDRVDEHPLVRDQLPGRLQLRDGGARRDACLEDGPQLDVDHWRERR